MKVRFLMTHAETSATVAARIYFSDFFAVSPELLEEYGAFDVSLINDLPLFIDPFLLFNSANPTYQQLHNDIIRYLRFLRDKSLTPGIRRPLLKAWYEFNEVKQNWLGFSQSGNGGSGLGPNFAAVLHANLATVFTNFGNEQITHGSHLEKVCLLGNGVGRDNISDFTTNLIKAFLLDYTENFAKAHIAPEFRRVVHISKVRFNYKTETWERGRYELPYLADDYVLLTPKDILTRDENWISRKDMMSNFEEVATAVSDEVLRAQLNNYFLSQLPIIPGMTSRERAQEKARAVNKTIQEYPQVIEYYIRYKEETGDHAVAISQEKVTEVQQQFVEQVRYFVATELAGTPFYQYADNSYEESMRRLLFLKHVIEDKNGYRIFYPGGKPVQNEKTLQLLFKFAWFATPFDVNGEVDNGRGPVDYTISRGSQDKCLVEFKLAKNTKLKQNLENQVPVYERAADTDKSIKAICYFTEAELERANTVLKDLNLQNAPNIVLIDARKDNKPSASNVKGAP